LTKYIILVLSLFISQVLTTFVFHKFYKPTAYKNNTKVHIKIESLGFQKYSNSNEYNVRD